MFTMRTSLMRFLFVAAFASVCLFGQAKTATAQTPHRFVVQLEATFAGELICVRDRPNCKTEKVILEFKSVGQDGSELQVTADTVRGGVRTGFGTGSLKYSKEYETQTVSGLLLISADSGYERAGTKLVFTLSTTSPNTLEGTLTDNNIVIRRLKLHRVKPNQVLPAPSPTSYPSSTAGPPVVQSDILQRLQSGSRFKLDREKSDGFDDIIVGTVVNGHVKVVDGTRRHVRPFSAATIEMIRPPEKVVINYTTSEVSVQFDNSAPLKSPRNGQPATWTRADGVKLELTSWLKDGLLIQVLTSSTETVTRTFSLSEDGRVLNIKVEASSRQSTGVRPPVQLNLNLTIITQTAVGTGNSQLL